MSPLYTKKRKKKRLPLKQGSYNAPNQKNGYKKCE